MAKKQKTAKKQPKAKGKSFSFEKLVFLIPALAIVLFISSTANDFALDDDVIFTNNSLVEAGWKHLPEALSNFSFEQENVSYSYRPVLVLSFMAQESLFGFDPMWAHLVNVLLYALCCYLAFLFFREILPKDKFQIAFVGALLFTIHPIHNEVVNNIKSRDEILMLCFGLGAILTGLYAVRKEKHLPLAGFFLLGLMAAYSKDNGAILIAFTPVILAFQGKRESIGSYLIILLASVILLLRIPLYHLPTRVYLAMGYILLMVLGLNLRAWVVTRKITLPLKQVLSKSKEISEQKNRPLTQASALLVLSLLAAWFDMRIFMVALLFLSIPYLWSNIPLLKLLPVLLLSIFGLAIENEVLLSLGGTGGFFYIWRHPNKSRWFGLIPVVIGMASLNPKYAGLMLVVAVFSSVGMKFNKERFLALLFILPCLILLAIFPQQTAGAVTAALISSGVWWLFRDRYPKVLSALPLVFLLAASWVTVATYMPADANEIQRIAVWNNKKVMSEEKTDESVKTEPKTPQMVGKEEISRTIKLAENPLDYLPGRSEKLGLAAASWGFYLKKLLFPARLSFYYGYNTIPAKPISAPLNLFWLFTLLAILTLGIYSYFKEKFIGLGLLFLVWNLVPFLNIAFPAPGIVAERFAFTPSLGFCLSMSFILFLLVGKLKVKSTKPMVTGTLIALVAISAFANWNRNGDWENMYALVEADIEKVPESAKMNQLYATNTMAQSLGEGNAPPNLQGIDKAIKHFRKCLEIDRSFPFSWFDLGNAYLVRNRVRLNQSSKGIQITDLDSAKIAFRKSVQVDSFYVEAPFFLASLHQEAGQVDSAEKYYLEAIRRDSNYIFSYTNLSMLYFNIENFDKSLKVNYQATKTNPDAYPPIINLGKTYMHIGANDSALKYLSKAYEINPGEPGLGDAVQKLKGKIKTQ